MLVGVGWLCLVVFGSVGSVGRCWMVLDGWLCWLVVLLVLVLWCCGVGV